MNASNEVRSLRSVLEAEIKPARYAAGQTNYVSKLGTYERAGELV